MATKRKPSAIETKFVHFQSVNAMKEYAFSPCSILENIDKARDHLTNADNEYFIGVPGGSPAMLRRLVEGDPEGETRVKAFAALLTASLPRAIGIGRRLVRGDQGDALDIHAVNRGNLDKAWSSSKRLVKPGHSIIRIAIDICANAGTSSEALSWRGVAGLAVTEVMARAGYSVELIAGIACDLYAGNGGKIPCCLTVTIKSKQGFTDKGLLSAVVCSAGFFRTVGFASLVHISDSAGKRAEGGIGSAVPLNSRLPVSEKITQLCVPNNVDDETSAIKWATQTITLLQGVRA